MRALAGMSFIALVWFFVPGAALCQPGAIKPAFDIADVHVSPRSDWVKTVPLRMDGGILAGDRYALRRATMLDLIAIAYNVDADKVFGGPSWLDYDRFEVVAKTKPGTRTETLRLMLQTLLADRFHLLVKMDTQSVTGYVLSMGRGSLKLNPAADGSVPSGCQNTLRHDAGVTYANFQCLNITMTGFASFLRGPMRQLPVADSTGIDGAWDVELQYAVGNLAAAGTSNGGVIEAVGKLGLKLEPGKVPQPVLTVENANEQPSANPPGVAEALPPLPAPEFEVASIRLSGGEGMTSSPHFQPGGRVTATGFPPLGLITLAWNLSPLEPPLGIPKSLLIGASHNVTIVAKTPASVSPDQNNLNAMMRALLIERYKMAVHYEDRPVDAYTLVAVKPKLTKADPANRTGCTRQIQAPPGKFGIVVRLDCRNMTMAQFAEQIPAYRPAIHCPVLDRTGLDGAWDFTVNYDTFGDRPSGRGSTAPDGEASDPTQSISFADAIQKQLGLKLEVHKRPEPVLVIDHMEEYPTAN